MMRRAACVWLQSHSPERNALKILFVYTTALDDTGRSARLSRLSTPPAKYMSANALWQKDNIRKRKKYWNRWTVRPRFWSFSGSGCSGKRFSSAWKRNRREIFFSRRIHKLHRPHTAGKQKNGSTVVFSSRNNGILKKCNYLASNIIL